MEYEKIIKLLRSTVIEDKQIGFEYLREKTGGNSHKMNKILYETNIRVNRYMGMYYMYILTVKGGKTITKFK